MAVAQSGGAVASPASSPASSPANPAPSLVADPAPEEPAAPTYKGTKHKLVVDKQEKELDYDDLIASAQRWHASQGRFQEAAALRKGTEQFLEDLKQGNFKRLAEVIGDQEAHNLAEALLMEKLNYSQLSDEQKEIRRLAEELESTKRRDQEREKTDAERRMDHLKNQAAQEIDNDIGAVLKSMNRKPTPRIVARIAEQMLAHLDTKGERMPASSAWERAHGELQEDVHEYLGGMTAADVKALPKAFLDMVRRSFVEDVTSQTPLQRSKPSTTRDERKPTKDKRRMTTDEWFARLDKKLK